MAATDSRLGAVIVAAGSSRRMGFDKIATPLGGEPLLRHTVRAFQLCAEVAEIVVVGSGGVIRGALEPGRWRAVEGGPSRQQSVELGLAGIESEYVAVHDGARPMVTPDLIVRCFEAARVHGGAAAAERVTDTLQRAGGAPVDRDGLWRMQTPQIFRAAELRRALEEARRAGVSVTDETSAWRRLGREVCFVENADWNFKVTYPRDVAVAEFILRSRAAAIST